MALPVLAWDFPEVGAKQKVEVKLLKSTFGDGYTQTSGDGINYRRKVWDLTWRYMTRQEAETLYSFFDDTCGGGVQPFLYTVPGTPDQLRWTCETYDYTINEAGFYAITATIKQSFNLDN